MDATTTMTRYSDALASRDWAALADLLAAGFAARLLHTGEVFDREEFVACNREYPGPWRLERDPVVGGGREAVVRARVHDGDVTYHLVSFGTVDREGLLTEVVEVWTDAVTGDGGAPHHHHAIDYVEVPVDDLPEAKRFYAEAFGWRFQEYGAAYAGILAPSGRGEVGGLDATGSGPTEERPLVLLHSLDLDATVAAVRTAGGTVTVPPYAFPGGRRFHFTDPGGTELGVWSTT